MGAVTGEDCHRDGGMTVSTSPDRWEPLSPQRRDEILERIAQRIKRYGLITPAVLFLEMNKPLTFIASQAVHFFSPIVGVFIANVEEYAYLMEDRENVDRLIRRLEELAEEEDRERRRKRTR